jgi:hypothetical protein
MGMMMMGLGGLAGLGSLICWIMVLIKMFSDGELGGVGKGILGIVCGIYAFIWGWQQNERHQLKTVMSAWTACIGVNIFANIGGAMM